MSRLTHSFVAQTRHSCADPLITNCQSRERQGKSRLPWVNLLIMSLKKTSGHLVSITACDGMQAPQQPAAQATRPTDTCYTAHNSVYGMVWGKWVIVCHLKPKQFYCGFSTVKKSFIVIVCSPLVQTLNDIIWSLLCTSLYCFTCFHFVKKPFFTFLESWQSSPKLHGGL